MWGIGVYNKDIKMKGALPMLYKNVDLCDLESILEKGFLSLNESNNQNWSNNKRSNNSNDVVYLFDPKTKQNTFTQYGIVLLEVDELK